MLEFKSTDNLSKLSPDDPVFPIVEDLVKRLITDYVAEGYEYRPEDDGWIVVIDEHDKDRVLTEIWSDWTLLDIPWEGITFRDGFYQAVFLANDQFGLVFIWPDAPWVDGELRKMIEDHLDFTVLQAVLTLSANSEVHSFIKNGDPKVAVNIPIIRVVVKVQAGSSDQGYLPQQSS
jgi:hypothetical protein